MATTDQYLGNPNLKKAHTSSRFTKKQIKEVMSCLESPKYFIENYLKKEGRVLIKAFQGESLDFITNYMKSRFETVRIRKP